MGDLQPSITASTEPVSLWLFARQIAGRECDAYLAWYDAKRGYMRAVDFERVAISVQRRWPNLDETQLFLQELRALEERATRLRGWARHLLATVIPSKVRRELIKGNRVITGLNGAGERVSLTLDDLAGLNIDLSSNSLIGPTTAYTDVSVRVVETASLTGCPKSTAPTSTPVRFGAATNVVTIPGAFVKRKRKTQAQWIEEADREVFPNGWGDLLVKERNARLVDWIHNQGGKFPEGEKGDRAFRHFYKEKK